MVDKGECSYTVATSTATSTESRSCTAIQELCLDLISSEKATEGVEMMISNHIAKL